jgi:hypothetical protein
MHKFPRIARYIALLALTLGALVPTHVAAADPALMLLEYSENDKIVQAKVLAKAGESVSPSRGKALQKIRVLAGNPLAIDRQPNDIIVEFRRGSGTEIETLCQITVRYFRDNRGLWIPHFQLVEQIAAFRGPDGRWRPFNSAPGSPSLIMMIGTSLPNAEGFYPALELGLTNGSLQIDSWTVH